MFVSCEDAMTYAIHASRNGQSVVTVRISPDAAIDKARLLESFGWQVHIADSAGRKFDVSDFVSRETAFPEIADNDASRLEKFN
jgi:hypothetical protein